MILSKVLYNTQHIYMSSEEEWQVQVNRTNITEILYIIFPVRGMTNNKIVIPTLLALVTVIAKCKNLRYDVIRMLKTSRNRKNFIKL